MEELQEKAANGRTEPWLCRLSDQQLYYVKGAQAGTKGLLNEAICAFLAKACGFNVPAYQFAWLPPQLMKYHPAARQTLGAGDNVVFASKQVRYLQELTPSLQQQMPTQFAKDLFLFDYWIKNEDRTLELSGGNPNLFYAAATAEFVVLDHNLAFDPAYNFGQNARLHLAYQHWFTDQHDQLWREYYSPRLEIALTGLAQYAASLPADWLAAEPMYFAHIFATLELFKTAGFWEALV